MFFPQVPSQYLRSSREYEAVRWHLARRIGEWPEGVVARPRPEKNELALQARFWAGEFGDHWTTLCGREVQLLDPGVWNREAGPDFREAVVLVDGTDRVRGDIELDLAASGWEQHGHATNPEFENVVLHVFFSAGRKRTYARTASHRAVLQVQLGDEFDPPPPLDLLAQPLTEVEEARRLIELAAQHRLVRKAGQAALTLHLHGPRNGFFQIVAGILGYRRNSVPMGLLAQRSGWKAAAGEDGEAFLFGLAGFLEAAPGVRPGSANCDYARELWQRWWKVRDREARLILPASAWHMGGQRPVSHPHRRVGALAAFARVLPGFWQTVDRVEAEAFQRRWTALTHPFWQTQWNLDGRALTGGKTLALVGRDRAQDLLINAFAPLVTARGEEGMRFWEGKTAGQVPEKIRELADWFCPSLPGGDLRIIRVQQGLLQLGRDFRGFVSPAALPRDFFPTTPKS
jgi:hypothetical protein